MRTAELAATVAATIAAGEQPRGIDWGLEGDFAGGGPQTEPGRDRPPVLYVEHEPLRPSFLARSAVRKAAVDATLGPVQCDSEQRPTVCIRHLVEGAREKPTHRIGVGA